jgi:hypothetical protein
MIESKYELVKVSQLKTADWNYKENDPILEEKLRNNIERNGQLENLIVRKLEDGTFEVVNGNHRLEAFKDLNVDEVMVCNVGEIPLELAQRIAIETNETRFATNQTRLTSLIRNISEKFELEDMAATMPYHLEDLKQMHQIEPLNSDSREEDEDDLDERYENYLNSQIKQIVLYFKTEDFEDVYGRLMDVQEQLGTSDNSATFLKLLEFYENNKPL